MGLGILYLVRYCTLGKELGLGILEHVSVLDHITAELTCTGTVL
jgi:hypothetical protein